MKKIIDWEQRAEQLFREIERGVPAAHHDDLESFRLLDLCDKHRDPVMTELVILDDVPAREREGCAWVMVEEMAGRLSWYLSGLERAFQGRLERKGVRDLPAPWSDDERDLVTEETPDQNELAED